jgi:hypothetical protein
VYTKYSFLSELSIINKIGADEFYGLLCKEMAIVPKCVSIKNIITNITKASNVTNNNPNTRNIHSEKNDNNANLIKNNKYQNQTKHNDRYYSNNSYLQNNKLIIAKSNGFLGSRADTSNNWRKR